MNLPNINVDTLITMFFQNLKRTKNQMLDALFLHTIEEITVGYAVKRASLDGSGYVSFGAWLSNNPLYQHLSPKEKAQKDRQIMEVSAVFLEWDAIVENLTRPSMAILEVRKFSINKFYRARRAQWCEEKRDEAIELRNVQRASHEYDEEAYQNIVQGTIRQGTVNN